MVGSVLVIKKMTFAFTFHIMSQSVHGQSSQTGSIAAESENKVDDVNLNPLNGNDIVDFADFELE